MRSRWIHWCVAGLVLFTAFRVGAQTTASDRETARRLMIEGRQAEQAGEYKRALDAYKGADAIMRVTTTGISVAKMQARLGLLVEAHDTALRVARIPSHPDEDAVLGLARGEAIELAENLEQRIPTLRVVVRGPEDAATVLLEIDGQPVPPNVAKYPRALNPGEHTILVRAAKFEAVQKKVALKERARDVVEIALEPASRAPVVVNSGGAEQPSEHAPERPTSSSSWITYAGFGVGGVGLAVGSLTGLITLSKASEIKDDCDGTRCPASLEGNGDSAGKMATVSNISFGVAAIGIGVGLYGLLSEDAQTTERDAAQEPAVRPIVGIGSVGVEGRF